MILCLSNFSCIAASSFTFSLFLLIFSHFLSSFQTFRHAFFPPWAPRSCVCVSKGMQLLKHRLIDDCSCSSLSFSFPFRTLKPSLSNKNRRNWIITDRNIDSPFSSSKHISLEMSTSLYDPKKWLILMNYPNHLFLLILLEILWKALDF